MFLPQYQDYAQFQSAPPLRLVGHSIIYTLQAGDKLPILSGGHDGGHDPWNDQ